MSRIGKKPVAVPEKVKVSIQGNLITVEGPLGKLELPFRREVSVTYDSTDSSIQVLPTQESRTARAMFGLYRALIQNMVTGVTTGYEKKLEIFGTGYLMAIQSGVLQVRAGFADEIQKKIPAGLTVKCPDQQHLHISGIDKQLVTQFAAEVRAIRKAEPYLGKGLKYEGEVIRRKESKAASKK